MTVYEFVDWCIDAGLLTVEIYSLDKGDIVWTGPGDELPDEYADCEIGSFDVPSMADHITLNID